MSTPTVRDAFTAVLPVRNLGERAGPYFARWSEGLAKIGRDFTLVVVDDGSTDDTAAKATANPKVKLLRHDSPQGIGACLRTALPEATHPLLLYATSDYPYEPADARKLLDVYGMEDEYTKLKVRVVNGCRCGIPKPAFWNYTGRFVRGFFRYFLGNPLDPYPGWLGFRNHANAWFAWAVFGDPFVDPSSGFKLFDRTLLDRFPIQSDGDFVHTEIVGKSTFLTTLMSEVPLTPKLDPVPAYRYGKDLWTVYKNPAFHHGVPAAPPIPESALPFAPA